MIKRESFPSPIVRISEKPSNVPDNIVHSAVDDMEFLGTAEASNNPD